MKPITFKNAEAKQATYLESFVRFPASTFSFGYVATFANRHLGSHFDVAAFALAGIINGFAVALINSDRASKSDPEARVGLEILRTAVSLTLSFATSFLFSAHRVKLTSLAVATLIAYTIARIMVAIIAIYTVDDPTLI